MHETYARVSPITHGVSDLSCPEFLVAVPRDAEHRDAEPTDAEPIEAAARPARHRESGTKRDADVGAVVSFAESLARTYAERLTLCEPGELHRV